MVLDIDTGMWLEQRGARLAWGSSPETLRNETQPDVCTVSADLRPATTLAWNDRIWGGLRCQVTTVFGSGKPPFLLRRSDDVLQVDSRGPRECNLLGGNARWRPHPAKGDPED